jgi:hypothetical protein
MCELGAKVLSHRSPECTTQLSMKELGNSENPPAAISCDLCDFPRAVSLVSKSVYDADPEAPPQKLESGGEMEGWITVIISVTKFPGPKRDKGMVKTAKHESSAGIVRQAK